MECFNLGRDTIEICYNISMSKKMTKKLVIANWKMNPASLKEAEGLFVEVANSMSLLKKTEVVICPPFIYLES